MLPRSKPQKDKIQVNRAPRWNPRVRPPKMKPRRPDIIVGIPTLNEAATIESLTKVIDEGLQRYFPDKKSLIVIVDSNSSDGTRNLFLNTKTKTPKRCLKAPQGKGAALKILFGYFLKKESAEVLIIIDGDVTSATPRWIRNLVTPILKGFDHNFPIFNRHEFDGSITNHLAYPVMRGLLGIHLRQPLAGEVGLSRKAVDRIYNRDWPAKADKYGIDIFMAFSSVLAELRISETFLGMKKHSPSEPNLHGMFEQIATSLFELLDENRGFWDGRLRVRKPPIFFKDTRTTKYPPADMDYRHLQKLAKEDFKKSRADIKRILSKDLFEKVDKLFRTNSKLHISADDWVDIVFAFTCASDISPAKRAKALRPIYYGRFLSFYKDSLDMGHKAVEQGIVSQAELFYKRRDKLLTKYNAV